MRVGSKRKNRFTKYMIVNNNVVEMVFFCPTDANPVKTIKEGRELIKISNDLSVDIGDVVTIKDEAVIIKPKKKSWWHLG